MSMMSLYLPVWVCNNGNAAALFPSCNTEMMQVTQHTNIYTTLCIVSHYVSCIPHLLKVISVAWKFSFVLLLSRPFSQGLDFSCKALVKGLDSPYQGKGQCFQPPARKKTQFRHQKTPETPVFSLPKSLLWIPKSRPKHKGTVL